MNTRPRGTRSRQGPRRRDVERSYSRNQFAAKLRRLATAIERGTTFRIDVAGKSLHVPAKAVASIEHERDGRSQELEFQFKWMTR